ncbi:CBS domain-containing protein [Halovenus sp. WSH3]|uniref:CBS domain-containing protein n=1 Tax=Halovenus carboxidivorans TaxID=2692199 RepID=A0A6B0SY49_9EURY|nr:CBS domain-containing protein [Halovenus carboxidivorans]MXR50474.1 CBS domain-containing protein [Halovenus carboxidivorans]
MNVEDIMTPAEDVVTVEIPGTRDDVLEYLQDRQFSSVPAIKIENGREIYRGIISRKALIERPDEDQLALLAEEVPTTTLDATLAEVAAQMAETGERRTPVVDGETLEGIVTVTDIVRAIAHGEAGEGITAGDVAKDEVNCVYSGAPLPVAERELSFAGVPYAVVLGDDGAMAGVLTEVDIIEVARVVEGEEDTGESIANQDDEWAWEGIKAVGNRYMPTRNVEIPAEDVSEFMTADVVTVSRKRPVEEVAQQMIEHDIEQIPLASSGRLAGIVQDMDLLEAIQ